MEAEVEFRIVEYEDGRFCAQIKDRLGWKGIDKSLFFSFTWYDRGDYIEDECLVKTRKRAERILNRHKKRLDKKRLKKEKNRLHIKKIHEFPSS